MSVDLSSLDLATLNVVRDSIVSAIRNQSCQWEQDSTDAAADGRLINALMLQHWAFAADLVSSMVSTECFQLFGRAVNARLNPSPNGQSIQETMLDLYAIELAAAQPDPTELQSA